MRVTIFGATGLLGKPLLRAWAQNSPTDQVSGLGSKDADLRDSAQVSDIVKRTQPHWIVLSAAYTHVDG